MEEPLNFDPIPDLGTIVFRYGQRYMLDEVEPYVRKDGEASTLLRWRSTCADCGAPFDFRTPIKSKGFNRRCALHRNPGARVSHRKGGKRKR